MTTQKKETKPNTGATSGRVRRLVRSLNSKWMADIEKWTENADALSDNPAESEYVSRCRVRAHEVRRCLNDLNSAFLSNSALSNHPQ